MEHLPGVFMEFDVHIFGNIDARFYEHTLP
jgi:hypothetical protein